MKYGVGSRKNFETSLNIHIVLVGKYRKVGRNFIK